MSINADVPRPGRVRSTHHLEVRPFKPNYRQLRLQYPPPEVVASQRCEPFSREQPLLGFRDQGLFNPGLKHFLGATRQSNFALGSSVLRNVEIEPVQPPLNNQLS